MLNSGIGVLLRGCRYAALVFCVGRLLRLLARPDHRVVAMKQRCMTQIVHASRQVR